MSADVRAAMARAFDALGFDGARQFAWVVRGQDAETLPCWGEIATAFETCFASDEERVAALEPLIAAGDWHALWLFIDAYAARPRVLDALVYSMPRMASPLQRAVVAVAWREGATLSSTELVDPAARELTRGGDDARRRELALLEGRVATLRGMRVRATKDQGPTSG